MIVQLTGTLVEVFPNSVVLDVQGVGYELGISANTAANLPACGQTAVTLLVRMIVKENAMELYGFSSRQERNAFDRLIGISGVGPKLALAVLSTYSLSDLATIALSEDVTRMAQVPGVGKKKAQRLLIELADVFAKDAELRILASAEEKSSGVCAQAPRHSVLDDAQSALLAMGFTPQEVEIALKPYDKKECNDNPSLTAQTVITQALQRLGGRL